MAIYRGYNPWNRAETTPVFHVLPAIFITAPWLWLFNDRPPTKKMAIVNQHPPPNVTEISGVMIRAYENPLVSLKAGYETLISGGLVDQPWFCSLSHYSGYRSPELSTNILSFFGARLAPRVPIFIFIELFFSPLEMAGYKWVSGVTDPNISGVVNRYWNNWFSRAHQKWFQVCLKSEEGPKSSGVRDDLFGCTRMY